MRISKEEMFLQIAEVVAQRSTCARLQVGSIIVDANLQDVISIGYNGNYKSGPNECDTTTPGSCGCLHSETNALLKAESRRDAILFTSHQPCFGCSKNLINYGIKRVYFRHTYRKDEGIDLLKELKIKVTKI